MKNTLCISVAILAFPFLVKAQEQSKFSWPDGKKAAVCLTYDDAIDCHLDLAIPMLNEYNIKATFYLTGSAASVSLRGDEWRSSAQNGHELGNHTLFHPCIKFIEGVRDFDWIRPEYDLDSYSFPQLMAELRTANSLLRALDGKDVRTFAYTCIDHTIQGVDFSDSIQSVFVGARGGGVVPTTMEDINVYLMPSTSGAERTGAQLIEEVKKAQKNGTVATLMFHSVGGGYLNTSAEAHRELLEYLSKNSQDLWIDTFGNVTQYIVEQKARDGKE